MRREDFGLIRINDDGTPFDPYEWMHSKQYQTISCSQGTEEQWNAYRKAFVEYLISQMPKPIHKVTLCRTEMEAGITFKDKIRWALENQ